MKRLLITAALIGATGGAAYHVGYNRGVKVTRAQDDILGNEVVDMYDKQVGKIEDSLWQCRQEAQQRGTR